MFCKYCGEELPEKSILCSNCRKQLFDETSVIKKAITTLPPKKQIIYIPHESSKSRLIAALLAFFFGDLGAHRFYVGKFFTGFIQLILGLSFLISLILFLFNKFEIAVLMALVGIVWGFWTLIDFIMILCGSFKDGKGLEITDWDL